VRDYIATLKLYSLKDASMHTSTSTYSHTMSNGGRREIREEGRSIDLAGYIR